ncbi:MAG: hypothetical protein OXI33_17740 [Chloroflexota bacterium]|nr:hypothetical protein [Chloroflexota bacterium]
MHSRPKGRYRVSRDALAEIEQAYEEYKQVVKTSGMALTSRKTYIIHADRFFRWLKREFQPGVHAGNRRPKRG